NLISLLSDPSPTSSDPSPQISLSPFSPQPFPLPLPPLPSPFCLPLTAPVRSSGRARPGGGPRGEGWGKGRRGGDGWLGDARSGQGKGGAAGARRQPQLRPHHRQPQLISVAGGRISSPSRVGGWPLLASLTGTRSVGPGTGGHPNLVMPKQPVMQAPARTKADPSLCHSAFSSQLVEEGRGSQLHSHQGRTTNFSSPVSECEYYCNLVQLGIYIMASSSVLTEA
ncbi:unnamed protein product, partial [Urochloa humidicola]